MNLIDLSLRNVLLMARSWWTGRKRRRPEDEGAPVVHVSQGEGRRRLKRKGTGGCISVAPPTIPFATELFCFVLQVAGPGGLPARGVWIVTGTQACRCNRYSYSTPSRCSPAAFQPADLSHLTLGGNSPFALSVSPRPLAAKLLNLEARNYLNLRWEICKRT